MLVKLRREYAQLVTSGAQLILLLVGFKLESRNSWLICLSVMASLSIMAWQEEIETASNSIRGGDFSSNF